MADNPDLDPTRLFRQIGSQIDQLPHEEIVGKLIEGEIVDPDIAEKLLNKRSALLKAIAVIAIGGATLYAIGKSHETDIKKLTEEIGFGPELEYRHIQTTQRAVDFLKDNTPFVQHNRKRSRWSKWKIGNPTHKPTILDSKGTIESQLQQGPDQEQWFKQRNCKDEDDEMFNPPDDVAPKDKEELILWAKQVCAKCVVREECLEFALKHKEPAGIWGGKTTAERRKLIKQRKKNK